jgi:hypothetical protein
MHTRRTLLARATLLAAALRSPASALATGSAPTFALQVGRVAGETAPLDPGRPFSLVGVGWATPERPSIQLRARPRNGPWSDWASAAGAGHGPDGAPRERIGDPIWVGEADEVQLRGAASGVRLHFVAASAQPDGRVAQLPLVPVDLAAGGGQPPIIARSAWSQGARPRVAPSYGDVRLAFVHHTENLNGYGAGAVPAMLYAIYLFHTDVRGWHDIGYNFVVDEFGRIWEAREGGVDAPVVGAQAGGYNAVSTGVAVLGSFQSALPSAAALSALQQLLAWKLSLHGVAAEGQVTVAVDPAGASYTPYAPGTHVTLPHIAGHRDGDSTDCPGDALYGQLPAVRGAVSAMAGVAARLTMAGALPSFGGGLALLDGTPLSGATVEVQRLASTGAWQTMASAVTAADGSWAAQLSLRTSALVRALHRATPAAVSAPLLAAPAPAVTLAVSGSGPFAARGTVAPPKRAVTVNLYAAAAGGHTGSLLSRTSAHVGAGGAFSAAVHAPGPGSYVLVAHTAADGQNAAGTSPAVYVTSG